jgi:hypothetical protein
MRFEMRTVVRVLSTFAMLLAFVVVAGATAQAQRRNVRVMREVTVERPDNGLHRGWYIGRHRGWSHSHHYGVTRRTTVVTSPGYRDVITRRSLRDERMARRERFERATNGDRVVTRTVERRRWHERP